MALGEYTAALTTSGLGRAVLVLDASGSAAAHRAEILAVARDVLGDVPKDMVRHVFFLGNPAPYPVSDFAVHAPAWFDENQGRASLLAPLWETAVADAPDVVAVIGAGPIFDLDDWTHHPLFGRVLLMAVGDSLQGSRRLADEIASASAQDLLRRIYDPATRKEIGGPGFMPTSWDNPRYELVSGDGGVSLRAERIDDYAVRLRFFAQRDAGVSVTTDRQSGRQTVEGLSAAPAGPDTARESLRLTPDEVRLFRKAANTERFQCLCHGTQHEWHELRCVEGASIRGELVYPSIEGLKGFVLFRVDGDEVWVSSHASQALRLTASQVAVRPRAEYGRACVYQYDEAAGTWRDTKQELAPYHRIGSDTYAVLL